MASPNAAAVRSTVPGSGSGSPVPGASTVDLLKELKLLVVSNQGGLDAVHGRLLDLIDKVELALVVHAVRPAAEPPRRAVLNPEEHAAKLLMMLEQLPEKRLNKPPSPFMVNELLPVDAVFGNVPGSAPGVRRGSVAPKVSRTLKKGTKPYEKKADEMRKQLAQLLKVIDNENKFQEEAGALYKLIHADGETLFFECEGPRQLEAMIFFRTVSASALATLLGLYFAVTRLAPFPMDSLLKNKAPFLPRLLDLLCTRPEVVVQRACLYMFTELADALSGDAGQAVLLAMNQHAKEHADQLHPLALVIDMMVTLRDGICVAAGAKLVNVLIKQAEAAQQLEALDALLEQTMFHRAMTQFTASPNAQSQSDIARELKKYQAWFLRGSMRMESVKFVLADAEHRKLVCSVWAARHRETPCPVTADSFGFNDETKDLWADLGFFADPSTYLTSLLVAQDLATFVATRTSQWLGILDKLAATRKMAEKAKGASIGKVDYDVVAVSAGLTSRIIELITSPASGVPAQRILWEDAGRTAIHCAGMEMARMVFTSYKLYSRDNVKQLLDDTFKNLAEALQNVPPTVAYLHRLIAFFGQRSTEQDRMKTLRGANAGQQLASGASSTSLLLSTSSSSSPSSAPGSPVTERHNKDKLDKGKPSAADLLKLAMGTGATAWKTDFPTLYKQSLEDFEPGPDGVPALIVALTEAVLSCGGESSVGLFRLQPSSEALQACEERLDSGARGADVFRSISDPNIPGMILKRILTALDPPLIDKYAAVTEAVRLNQFSLLTEILKKVAGMRWTRVTPLTALQLEPVNKATLNFLMTFFRYLSDPALVEKTKMDAGNVCMVFAPTMLRDVERSDRPSFGASFLEKDLLLYLSQVSDPIP